MDQLTQDEYLRLRRSVAKMGGMLHLKVMSGKGMIFDGWLAGADTITIETKQGLGRFVKHLVLTWSACGHTWDEIIVIPSSGPLVDKPLVIELC